MEIVLKILFEISFDMIAILSLSGEFRHINPAFQRVLGWTLTVLDKKSFWDLIISDIGTDPPSVSKNMSKGHPVIIVENHFNYFDGTVHLLHWTAYPDLKSGNIIAMIRDSSLTSESQEYFRQTIEVSPTAMFFVNRGKISYTNKLAEPLFGYSQGEMIGNEIEMLVPNHMRSIHKQHRNRYDEQLHLRKMGLNLELSSQKTNGDQFPLDIGFNPINTPEGVAILCSVIDLTRQKASDALNAEKILELEKEISVLGRLAQTDELTGILNRRALFKQLELLIRVAQNEKHPISFILFDIDNFKKYNDTYGYLKAIRC